MAQASWALSSSDRVEVSEVKNKKRKTSLEDKELGPGGEGAGTPTVSHKGCGAQGPALRHQLRMTVQWGSATPGVLA